MSLIHQPSRRLFLQQAAALGTFGASAPLALNLAAMGSAAAATASDYKAIVCVFLQGGNDHFNTVLATDSSSWGNYQTLRRQAPDSLALLKDVAPDAAARAATPAWLGGVLPIVPANTQARTFALHPSLPDLRRLFNDSKRLAVLSNVGTLVEPVTKTAVEANKARLPNPLYSHNDQSSQWLAMAPEGASRGWGGRMADAFASTNGQAMFTAISTSGNSVWLYGDQVKQYHLSSAGAVPYGFWRDAQGVERIGASVVAAEVIKRHATNPAVNHVLMKDLASVNQSSIRAETLLSQALPDPESAPFGPSALMRLALPVSGTVDNSLATQLRTVARMVAAGPSLGLRRQVFFVTLGGFDTHDNQNRRHTELMMQLNHGLAYFDNVLQSLGMADRVTTFTGSDFGRTFTSNGDGTDHGWGSHHIVMGGAVKGGDIYGAFPVLGAKNTNNNGFASSGDQLYNGVLLPKQSVTQVGATLGRWFGLSATQLTDTFPLLPNFGSATDLGFMKA